MAAPVTAERAEQIIDDIALEQEVGMFLFLIIFLNMKRLCFDMMSRNLVYFCVTM